MKCKIIFERDPKTLKVTDKIKAVKAPNGKRSLLFDSIKNDIKDDNEALVNYYKVYTNEFKELFGDWENTNKFKIDDELEIHRKITKEEYDSIDITPTKKGNNSEAKELNESETYYQRNINPRSGVGNQYSHFDKTFETLFNKLKEINDVVAYGYKEEGVKSDLMIWMNQHEKGSKLLEKIKNNRDKLRKLIILSNDVNFTNPETYIKKFGRDALELRKQEYNSIPPNLNRELRKESIELNENKELFIDEIAIPGLYSEVILNLRSKLSKYTDDDTINNILKFIIKDPYQLQPKENLDIGKMLIKGIIEDSGINNKLDKNGEPKYSEIKDIISPTGVEFDDDLNTKLKDLFKELYPEIKLEYTNEVITPDNNSLYQHDTVESKPLTFDEIEDISNYIVKLDSVSERDYKPRTNTIEIETKNPIYNERRRDIIDDVFKTSPDNISKLNINVKLVAKVLPFKGKDLSVRFNKDRIEFVNKKGNVISVVKNLSKVQKENVQEYLENNDDSVDSFIKGYFDFVQNKYEYYIIKASSEINWFGREIEIKTKDSEGIDKQYPPFIYKNKKGNLFTFGVDKILDLESIENGSSERVLLTDNSLFYNGNNDKIISAGLIGGSPVKGAIDHTFYINDGKGPLSNEERTELKENLRKLHIKKRKLERTVKKFQDQYDKLPASRKVPANLKYLKSKQGVVNEEIAQINDEITANIGKGQSVAGLAWYVKVDFDDKRFLYEFQTDVLNDLNKNLKESNDFSKEYYINKYKYTAINKIVAKHFTKLGVKEPWRGETFDPLSDIKKSLDRDGMIEHLQSKLISNDFDPSRDQRIVYNFINKLNPSSASELENILNSYSDEVKDIILSYFSKIKKYIETGDMGRVGSLKQFIGYNKTVYFNKYVKPKVNQKTIFGIKAQNSSKKAQLLINAIENVPNILDRVYDSIEKEYKRVEDYVDSQIKSIPKNEFSKRDKINARLYKKMFGTLIEQGIQQAKKDGFDTIYLPTAESIRMAETLGSSGDPSILYATPKELNKEYTYKDVRTDKEESNSYTSVGPFYSSLSKIKNISISYETPKNSKVELIKVDISNYSTEGINMFQKENGSIIGKANIEAGTVLINALKQKQDTLPHEYAHHYIAWFRNTPIVQEGIKKWGSEEALVQAIGEQVVKQKGEAYNWWNRFVKFILDKVGGLSGLKKEQLRNVLTDAFLTREDLNTKLKETNKDNDVSLKSKLPDDTIIFKTSKGSKYTFKDGKTSREKVSVTGGISKFGEVDQTVFMTNDVILKLLSDISSQKLEFDITDNTLSVTQEDFSGYKSTSKYPITNTPAVNLHPFELIFRIDDSNTDQLNNANIINPKGISMNPNGVSFHPGNAITSIELSKSKLPDDTGDIDNTVKEKYFNDGDTQSHTTILQRIIDDKHPLAPLAEKLLSLSSEDMTVELVDKPYIETDEYKSGLKGEKSSKSAATYQEFGEGDTKRRVINIASRAPINTKDLVPVILHEMLHGYTISELNKNTKVARQLNKIYKEALKYKDEFRDDYPLTNLNEFIVAVYTNPYFIQDLQKLPSLGPNKSLWEDLLKYFKALFEFNANERTLFDDAFYVSNKVLENYSDSVKERSIIKHKDPSNEFFEKIYNVEITEETVGSEDKQDVAKPTSKVTPTEIDSFMEVLKTTKNKDEILSNEEYLSRFPSFATFKDIAVAGEKAREEHGILQSGELFNFIGKQGKGDTSKVWNGGKKDADGNFIPITVEEFMSEFEISKEDATELKRLVERDRVLIPIFQDANDKLYPLTLKLGEEVVKDFKERLINTVGKEKADIVWDKITIPKDKVEGRAFRFVSQFGYKNGELEDIKAAKKIIVEDTAKDIVKPTTKEGPTTIIKTKKLPVQPTKKSAKKTTISDSTIEDKFNLRNTDGSRKRYTDYNKALDKTRKLNKANRDRPFKFTIIKILGEKGDPSRTYYAIKVVPRGGDTKYSLSGGYAGQPKTDTESSAGQSTTKSGVGIPVDVFKNAKDKNGKDLYSEDQIKVIETYNNKTSLLTGEMVPVDVEELPFILRETFKKKGIKTTMLYGANNKKGYIIGRVSHAQDIIKTKKQTEEKATAQEHSPASVLARNMGTDMHSLNEAILKYITESNNPGFEFKDNLRSLDVNLWKEDAMKAFKETDEYKSLLKKGNDIFLNKSYTSQGVTTKSHDSDRMIDKLVESMLSLYHQVSVTQDEINRSINEGKEVDERVKHKPLFMLEKPVLDPAGSTDASGDKSVAGTMDIFVVFSDGSASIYDHKFTNLRPEKREFKNPTAKQRDKIYEIRRAQGLSTKRWKYNDFYYVLPDDAVSFMKQESWNAQIGRYSQMVTSLYGVKKIRQARILPIATTYTREKTGEKRKNKKGEEFEVTALNPETSKVEFILTGQEDEGIAQWALDIEKTGDLKLDEFIKKLIDTKKALHAERVEKKAWNDPKYIDRIKKLDESIQALLIDRKLNKIADSINSLAVQIENDLQSDDITFEQIITHLRDIKTFESFTKLTGVTLKNLEEKYKDEIEAGEDNEYTTFSNNLMRARYKLNKNEGLLQNKLTSMVYDVNREGGYMSEKLFASLETQMDMGSRGGALASWFTHLRNSNHPLISLFSQVLDKVDTNVIKERRELESKVNKATKELAKWGESKGLSGVKIYKDILTENDKLIFKYTNYKKEVFPDYSDPKNKSNNIKWFNENFERVGVKDEIFKERLKRFKEYFDSTSIDENGKVNKKLAEEKLNEWRNKNDVEYNKGNNDAWTNIYVQGLLTPKNPEEYYTEEYKNLLRSENKPLLDFYNMYTEQMNKLAVKADFKIGENWLPEIRKDMIDTMVQDGYITGLKQQYNNVKNAIKVVDADDGFQQVQTDDYLGSRKVPIFFTHSVGKGNKSLDLSKSLMIFSDFVHKYKGHKDNEYAILAMRELLANTTGVKQTKGKLGLFKTAARDEANNILKSKDNNAEMLKAFDKWIKFYIYGEKKQDSSAAANKVVDTMVKVSSYKSIALNMLSASAGHVNAEAQLNYLAKKANYFSRESLGKSRKDQKRFKALLESFRKSTKDTEKVESKMLFAAMFFEMAQESLTYEKANSVSASTMRSTMKKDFAYFMQRWSDDVIDNTTLGAMMRDYAIDPTTGHAQPIYKLKEFYKNNPKYKNTEWKSLWDSIIMHGQDLPDSLTSEQRDKLDMSKGPVILNQHTGEIMGDKTFTDFRRKAKEVVSRAKGNMSNADTALYKTYAVGRLLMQYRGWIPSTVLERVKSEQYNLTMEQFEVGRWVAAQKMLLRRVDSKWKQFLIQVIPFVEADFSENTSTDILDEMTPMQIKYRQFIADNPHLEPDKDNPSIDQISYEEYYNTYVGELKILAKEIQTYFAIAGVGMLFLMAGGDDEYKENPLMRGLMELIDRVLLELGFFLPAPYVGLGETMQLVTRKPAASVDVITSTGKTITNTFTELFDFISGVESDEKRVLDLTGPFELEWVTKKDKTSKGYYFHQWVPPLKLGDKLFGFYDDSDARETWWDYVTGEDFVK